jgi:hypothetical protein
VLQLSEARDKQHEATARMKDDIHEELGFVIQAWVCRYCVVRT